MCNNPSSHQPSPEFLAAVVSAVKASLAVKRSSLTTPVSAVGPVSASSSTTTGIVGDIPSLPGNLGAKANALLDAGSAVPFAQSGASGVVGQGRAACVVPSFVSTLAAPVPSIGSSCALAAPGLAGSPLPTVNTSSFSQLALPPLQQPFVVGPGYSPVPAKLVSQIVSGKFVDLGELLSKNAAVVEPEPQLLFDGRVVLTSAPKKPKRRIEDTITWMEVFSIYCSILTSYFPH